ncbi:hypothetical protein [Tomitella biformata]|uniref:hypothetical protein n=1 Tax=Tomitella biformata TaxID=630403 RepID=UPI0004667CD9|nr:hypothetical protein [Tomitella biformata]
MTTPAPAPFTAEQVRQYLRLDAGVDTDLLEGTTAAVIDLIGGWKGDPAVWRPKWTQGGIMLAARLYRRRNSPAGVESFGDMGTAYVQRNDPDLALLLDLGRYTAPAVG